MLALKNENADMAATISDLRAFKNENAEMAVTIQATIQATIMDLRAFIQSQDMKQPHLYTSSLEPRKTASDERFKENARPPHIQRHEEGVCTVPSITIHHSIFNVALRGGEMSTKFSLHSLVSNPCYL